MTSSSSSRHLRWNRPIAIHNQPLQPAVSFVVAQPQQTRSLASATDKLPNILLSAMQDNPPQHSTTPPPAENHDHPSIAGSPTKSLPLNGVHESNQSALALQDPARDNPPVLTADQIHATLPADQPVPPVPSSSPTTLSQDPTSKSSLSDKPSWFNVFSWSSGKGNSIAEVKAEMDSVPQVPDTVRCTPAISSEDNTHLESRETFKSSDTAGAIGNTSPHTDTLSPPRHSAPRSPHTTPILPSNINDGNAPSVCEEQPVPQLPPSSLPQYPPAPRTQESSSAPTTSNLAISVFTFNFSVLPKSRPLPDAAVPPPTLESSSEAPCVPSDAPRDPGNTRNATLINETDATRTPSTSTIHVSERGNQSPSQPAAVTEPRTNTWWTYVGLNKTSTALQAEPSVRNAEPIGTHTSSAEPTTSHPTEGSQPEGEIITQVDPSSDVGEHPLSNDKKPSSVQNADPARFPQPQGFTWYAPWSWYQLSSPSSTVTTTAASDMNSDSQHGSPEHNQTRSKIEENDPAGGRGDHALPDPSSLSPQEPSAPGSDYRNPVQSVISTNPTGWMSFFSAKAVAMRSIAYETEEGKMEVMEIDDETVPESTSVPSSAPTVIQPSPTRVTKPIARLQPHTSDIPPPSSPPFKGSDDKRSHAATNPESAISDALRRQPSPSPSKKSGVKTPTSPPPPNLVLPTWNDTFDTLPRSVVPPEPASALSKTLQYVSGVLFSREEATSSKGKGKAKEPVYSPYDKALPRTWDVVGGGQGADVLRGCKRVVIIGIHGWFPGTVLRTLAGEPTGTSSKFVNGIVDALDVFQEEHKVKLDKVTKIPLEGEGTINRRVDRLYQNLVGNKEWMEDLHDADAIFIATHSQGSVVSTHLLDRLIADRHIRTPLNADASIPAGGVASGSIVLPRPPQRVCCLSLCGIHLGPLRYLSTSSLVQPYIQYFESTAARELFEFQNTETPISRDYVRALRNVLNNGIKMVYIASLNDQVVGLYSGLFTSVSHPLILRALYIDGDAYHPSDFLSKLLVLLLRIRNAGLSDGGLLTHLSEVTAGSLNGIGHSTPYEERATYSLAVKYLFLTDCGSGAPVEFVEEPFNALAERNDYEIPWALRDLIADEKVAGLFSDDIVALRDAFRDWHPKTSALRDVKRKLQPIQRLSSALMASHTSRL